MNAGTIKMIVTEDMSRMSRDFADSAMIFKCLQFKRVPLVGVADGIDTSALGAKMVFTLKSLMSDMYLSVGASGHHVEMLDHRVETFVFDADVKHEPITGNAATILHALTDIEHIHAAVIGFREGAPALCRALLLDAYDRDPDLWLKRHKVDEVEITHLRCNAFPAHQALHAGLRESDGVPEIKRGHSAWLFARGVTR